MNNKIQNILAKEFLEVSYSYKNFDLVLERGKWVPKKRGDEDDKAPELLWRGSYENSRLLKFKYKEANVHSD